MSASYNSDLEKEGAIDTKVADVTSLESQKRHGWTAGLWKIMNKLDSYGVEARGVERVLDHERNEKASVTDAGTMWFSANCTISTLSLGTLGASIYELGFVEAALTILFFNLLATIPVALMSVWGKETGLRQMMVGRYSWGSIGIFVPVVLNVIACLGWSTINSLAGASTLRAVSIGHSHPIPAWGAILVIAFMTMVVALFGYRWVHTFERYASIPVFITLIIVAIEAGPHMMSSMGPPGRTTAAGVLSFGGSIVGFAIGWVSLAGDYTVNMPKKASNAKVFLCTYVGLILPMVLIELLGAALMTTFESKTTWGDFYDQYSVGGLLYGPLIAMGGFGRFLLVILSLSIVANNIPNMYSFALSVLALHKSLMVIPRFFLVLVGTIIYTVLAIVGADHFETALDLLLVLLAYWLAIYAVILLEEHYFFRRGTFDESRGSGYDLTRYNDTTYLPIGYAALLAAACGIAGAVIGMAQVWYVGPLAKAISSPFGGDIGFELSGGFTAVVYPIARYFERKYTRR